MRSMPLEVFSSLSDTPPSSTGVFLVVSRLCSMDSIFSDRRACMVFLITSVVPCESAEKFSKNPFLALFYSLLINDFPAFLPFVYANSPLLHF